MALGSAIRDPRSGIPDPGVEKAPDPESRIRILNTGLKRRVRNSTQGFGRNFVILSLNMTLSWLLRAFYCKYVQ
jgi:hypothetical protein